MSRRTGGFYTPVANQCAPEAARVVASGAIKESRIDQSYRRIMQLKERLAGQ